MAPIFTSFAVGLLFGLGLSVAEMTHPSRVSGFLDVTGRWDPTLMAVMAGALAIAFPLFSWIGRRNRAVHGGAIQWPTQRNIDRRLVGGAVLFGIGWGLGGYCPGPALANLATASPGVILFVAAMIIGQWLALVFQRKD